MKSTWKRQNQIVTGNQGGGRPLITIGSQLTSKKLNLDHDDENSYNKKHCVDSDGCNNTQSVEAVDQSHRQQ